MRILHCPTSVGGHSNGISRAERELGVASWSVAFNQSPFGHSCDECLWKDGISLFHKELLRWKLLMKAFLRFDVIHYNFGTPILRWQFDPQKIRKNAKLLHILLSGYVNSCYFIERNILQNKIIAVTYQGDDARQSDYSKALFKYSIAQEVDDAYYPEGSDQRKRDLIKKFDKIAANIYALNPDLLYVLPHRTKFIPYAHIDLNDWIPSEHPRSKIPVILHAPSHSGAKGTRFVLDAVSQLRQEGINFEFILVESKNRSEARKLYERCDLAIDQLLAGWYGGFAVEAMALGKPVITYIREEDTRFIPDEMKQELPFIQASPGTICAILREWLTQKVNELPARGAISRSFVEKWHDPLKIAQSFIKGYKKHSIGRKYEKD